MCAVDIRVSIYDIDMCVEDISCSVMHELDKNIRFSDVMSTQNKWNFGV